MDREAMMSVFRLHREAEARRDYDAVMDTFTTDCYLETVALGFGAKDGRLPERPMSGTSRRFPISPQRTRASAQVMTCSFHGGFCEAPAEATGSAFRRAGAHLLCSSRTSPPSRTNSCVGRRSTSIWRRCANRQGSPSA